MQRKHDSNTIANHPWIIRRYMRAHLYPLVDMNYFKPKNVVITVSRFSKERMKDEEV